MSFDSLYTSATVISLEASVLPAAILCLGVVHKLSGRVLGQTLGNELHAIGAITSHNYYRTNNTTTKIRPSNYRLLTILKTTLREKSKKSDNNFFHKMTSIPLPAERDLPEVNGRSCYIWWFITGGDSILESKLFAALQSNRKSLNTSVAFADNFALQPDSF